MSDYRLLQDVTLGLKGLLQADSAATPLPLPLQVETKPPPPDAQANADNKVSLWLYQITENEFLKNQPPARRAAANGGGNGTGSTWEARVPPLALNLYYLLTPLADREEQGQLLLGKVMRILYDNGTVVLAGADASSHELRISLCRMTLEELTRVWDALRQPYRLSVCYQVRVAQIDSRRDLSHARVLEQTTGLAEHEGA